MGLLRIHRRGAGIVTAGVCLCALIAPGRGDEAFHAAVERAAAEYRHAMATLETRGREETAAAVHRFRESWQVLADRFGARPPPALAGDDGYAGMLMLVDARLIGALVVIDIGSREAARAALLPIAQTLDELSARAGPAR